LLVHSPVEEGLVDPHGLTGLLEIDLSQRTMP
jgi:hypothetical protein